MLDSLNVKVAEVSFRRKKARVHEELVLLCMTEKYAGSA